MSVRIYTVEEANRRLPEVECSLRVMQSAHEQIREVQDRIAVLEMIGATRPSSPEHEELQTIVAGLTEYRRVLQREGERLAAAQVILRDVATGLVDFPASHQGRLVYLCWRVGEPSIQYWHETFAGAAGRRPVSELDRKDVSSDGRSE